MDKVPDHSSASVGERRSMQEIRSIQAPKRKQRRSKRRVILTSFIIIAAVAVVACIGLLFYRVSTSSTIDSTRYQAVFFTNGQVYFGKLKTVNSSYLKLTDIFYLQTKTADSTNPQQTTTSTANNVELVKLGNEIHGPEDSMIINKDQILFFENLKNNGKVSQSITKYKAQ